MSSDEEELIRPKTSFFDEPITAHYKHWLLHKNENRGCSIMESTEEESTSTSSIREALAKQWDEKQKKELEEDFSEGAGNGDAKEVLQSQQMIATIRKDNVFASDLTEEENEIVRQRVELQRKQFEQFLRRQNEKRTRKIRSIHPYITEQEALQALKECHEDEVSLLFS